MDREIIGEKEENAVSCSAIVTDWAYRGSHTWSQVLPSLYEAARGNSIKTKVLPVIQSFHRVPLSYTIL
jgi:hypothetical protein